MNNGAFGENEKLITEWINRYVTVVIHWIFCECAGYSLENGLAWIWNGFCTVAGDHNSICCQIHFIRIRLYETALIRHISIRNFKPRIQTSKETIEIEYGEMIGENSFLSLSHTETN